MLYDNVNFRDVIKNVEEFLSGIEDISAAYLRSLIYDETFQSFIKSIIQDEEKKNTTDVYVEAIKKGYRLCDIQACIDIIIDEVFNSVSLPIIKTNDVEKNNVISIQEQEEINKEEYFFTIKYTTTEYVGEEAAEQIEIESNLIDFEFIKDIIVERFEHYNFDDNKIVLEVDSQIDYFTQLGMEKYQLSNYTYTKERKKGYITTKGDGLEDVYYYLRHYLFSINERVEVENIFIEIRNEICKFSDITQNVKIERVIQDETLVKKFAEVDYFTIKDLLSDTILGISRDEANYVYEVITNLDVVMPSEHLHNIINTLEPREIAVIRERYLGDCIQPLEVVGKKYGCTRERIRQIEQKAYKKLSHPSRKKEQLKMIEVIKMYCANTSFVFEEELKEYFEINTFGLFADKLLNLMVWSETYNVGFFNKDVEQLLNLELEELPNEFTISELEDYAGYINDNISELSKEEIKTLILRRYNVCGDFIVKGRIKLRAVLSFLMNTYFPNGLDIYEDNSILFLREKAREHFDGFELAENDRAIRARLQDFCTPVGRGVWKWDSDETVITLELKNAIIEFIENYNAPILPIQGIMDEFRDELVKLEIDNKYYLQGQIKKFIPTGYSINRDYVFKGDADSFYKVVEGFVKNAKGIVTKKDIMKQFPGVSEIVIQQVALYTKVLNMNGYYVHLDNLNITQDELDVFENSIKEYVCEKIIYHAKNVFNYVKNKNSGLFSRIGIMHYLQFYYLLKELFPNKYEYNRPFLAPLGVNVISGEAQVLDRICDKGEVTIAQLREIVKEVGTIIDRYIEFVDGNSDSIIFKNHTTIISIDCAGLDDNSFARLDEILMDYIKEENYISLSTFFDYWKLPSLKWNWNEWTLYSIVNKYSQKFKTAVTSNFLHEATPILVRKDYDEKLIDFSNIERQEMEEEQEDLLDVLDYDDLE